MSIVHSFDHQTKAMIDPEEIVKVKASVQLNTCIVFWSHKVIDELVAKDMVEELCALSSGNGPRPIYRIRGTDIGAFMAPVGGPGTIGMCEEVKVALGIKNIIAYGTCGGLVEIERGKCILPAAAYRDEGTSYHYAPASDYIEIKNQAKLAKIFYDLNVDFVEGKVWTTDAIYRETVGNRDKRVAEGCIAVDMECSALQAFCDFRGLELYQFFYAADSLSGAKWDARILGNLEISKRMIFFNLALEVAKIVDKL